MKKNDKEFIRNDIVRIPKVFIIILNYNGWKDTIECLDSLMKINYSNYQVVIVDNNSSNNSVEQIKKWCTGEIKYRNNSFEENNPIKCIEYSREEAENGGIKNEEISIEQSISNEKLVLINSGENLGFSGGNNIGIKYALKKNADYVLLLNNDTIVNPDFLSPLVESMSMNNNVGIVGGKIINYYDENEFIAGGFIDLNKGSGYHNYNRHKESPEEVSFLSGCIWLVKREVFEEVGYLDEKFFLYVEDVEFCYRVSCGGKKLVYNPNSEIYHKESRSTGKGSPLVLYYNTRNRMYFVKKCYNSHFKKMIFYIFFFSSRLFKLIFEKSNRKYIIKAFLDYKNDNLGKSDFI